MTAHSIAHDSFRIERTYPATPQRVFAAWATESGKSKWFGGADDLGLSNATYSLDFRVGGVEHLGGTLPDGRTFTLDVYYQDIVDGHRFVCSYDVCVDGVRASVSLMTVEIAALPDGTSLVLTEQGAFLDGLDSNAERIEGATAMLELLDKYLAEGQDV